MLVINFKILYGTIFETINNFLPVSFKVVRSRPFDDLPAQDFICGSMAAKMGVIHICIKYPAAFINYHISGVGGFDYCPVSFFAVAQCFFRQLACSDIFDKKYAPHWLALAANGASVDPDESTPSI